MSDVLPLTRELLAAHPLPDHGTESSKAERGTALLAGGTAETPGAVLLAATAAMRAAAGTVQVATAPEATVPLAIALPETRVVADDLGTVAELAAEADSVLLGTGCWDAGPLRELLEATVDAIGGSEAVLVVDAAALDALEPAVIAPVVERTILMPNPAEMARLLGCELDDVLDDADGALARAVERFGCTVSLRAAETRIAGPATPTHLDTSGNIGLAASGSGDVLAGLLAGFAARGADPLTTVLWATAVHGRAGERCAEPAGPLGYLARELTDQVPAALADLTT